MEQRVILRGLLMGALGGVLSFIYARTFAEPVIQRAIDYESGRDDAMADLARAAGLTPAGDGPDIFSRTIQANIGIGFGMLLFGVAMGGIFAVVYCVTVGRIGDVSARAAALLVGGGLFFALYVVPFVKYPPNPPSIVTRRPSRTGRVCMSSWSPCRSSSCSAQSCWGDAWRRGSTPGRRCCSRPERSSS